MSAKKVRLRDVATASGVSTKTASRVINGDPRVSEETRRRVQAVADELGYRVDVMARSLRKGIDTTVGVIVPTIGDPFFASMIEEIERVALGRDLNVLIASNSRDAGHERAMVEGLLGRRVAGLIIVPYSTDYSFIEHVSTPLVFLDRHPIGIRRDVVLVDDVAGARTATNHLLSMGHRRIGIIGDDIAVRTSAARLDGYLAALASAGIAPDPKLQKMFCTDAGDAAEATEQFLRLPDPPTAILSCRSETSIGVVPALHSAGRTDIAFLSFGDFAMADVLNPAISVIDHDPRKLAVAAMERLIARLDGDAHAPQETIVPLALVQRGSAEQRPQPRVVSGASHA